VKKGYILKGKKCTEEDSCYGGSGRGGSFGGGEGLPANTFQGRAADCGGEKGGRLTVFRNISPRREKRGGEITHHPDRR